MALLTSRPLMAGAGPVLLGEDRPAPLAHLLVEAGVMGDDHHGISCKGLHGGIVDPLSSDVGIGDAGRHFLSCWTAPAASSSASRSATLWAPSSSSAGETPPHYTGMTRGNPLNLSPGKGTNDISVALAHAEILLDVPNFDPADLMNRFVARHKTGCLPLHRHLLRCGYHYPAGAKSRLANHP